MTDPDTDLTAWQRDGDRVALERAVQALLPVGQAIANRILEPSAADDAVQSAVVRMLRALPRYRRTGAGAMAWFAAIVANECRTHLRRERAIHERHRRAAPPTAPDAEPDLEMVRAALAAIPDHERSAVALHHMAGRTVAETARALGCAERTARSWIGSGLQRLRRRLGAAGILLLAGVAAQGAEPSAATRAAVDDRVAAARPPGTRGIAIAGAAAAALAAAGIVLLLRMGGPEPAGAPPAEAGRTANPGTAPAAAAVAPAPGAGPDAAPAPRIARPAGRFAGRADDGGPALRWIGNRARDADRRLIILGHAGTDEEQARALADGLGGILVRTGWEVVVAWRSEDPEGAHPRPADALRLRAALHRSGPVPALRTALLGSSWGGDHALAGVLSGLVPAAAVVAWPGRAPRRTDLPVPTLIAGSVQDELGWGPALAASAERLRAADIPVTLHLVEGREHIPDRAPADATALARWLEQHIPATPAAGTDATALREGLAAVADRDLPALVRDRGDDLGPDDLPAGFERLSRARLPAARLALAGALHGALLRTGRRPPAGTDPGAALDRAAGGDTDAVAAWQTAWGQAGPGR